jgi:hypothetical protein
MKKVILIAMLITAGYSKMFGQVVVSDKTGWHKIAEKTVDFKTETDDISVIGADRFQSIKIKVIDAPINIISFVIYFESGDQQNVKIGQNIKNPGETREIVLNGGERDIDKITLKYKTVPNSKDQKAQLEIWGLKTNPDKKK